MDSIHAVSLRALAHNIPVNTTKEEIDRGDVHRLPRLRQGIRLFLGGNEGRGRALKPLYLGKIERHLLMALLNGQEIKAAAAEIGMRHNTAHMRLTRCREQNEGVTLYQLVAALSVQEYEAGRKE